MNLIPMPRASGQWLKVSLLVGIELANTLRQLFVKTDSIGYTGNDSGLSIRELCNRVSVVSMVQPQMSSAGSLTA